MSKATKTTNEVRNAIQNRRTVKKIQKRSCSYTADYRIAGYGSLGS